MLSSRYSTTGVTLIELLIGVTIVGIILIMGLPSFKSWVQNTQIRTATEAIQNGLELARAEAVRRNTLVRFQLTSTMDSSCVLTTASSNWVVSLDNPSSLCHIPTSDTTAPRIIQQRQVREGSVNTVVASQEVTSAGVAATTPVYNGSITFNGTGRVSAASVTTGNNVWIDITNPTVGGACQPAGPMRCLRIVISSGGLIRSCNPLWSSNPALTNYDPQGC